MQFSHNVTEIVSKYQTPLNHKVLGLGFFSDIFTIIPPEIGRNVFFFWMLLILIKAAQSDFFPVCRNIKPSPGVFLFFPRPSWVLRPLVDQPERGGAIIGGQVWHLSDKP